MQTGKNWILINIVLPLLPLVLRGVIKLMYHSLSFEIIHGGELWFCLAIMSLMIDQDLKATRSLLSNEDKEKELSDRRSTFTVGILVFIFMCATTEMAYEMSKSTKNDIQESAFYKCCTGASYACTIIFIWYSLQIRKRFDLESKFF